MYKIDDLTISAQMPHSGQTMTPLLKLCPEHFNLSTNSIIAMAGMETEGLHPSLTRSNQSQNLHQTFSSQEVMTFFSSCNAITGIQEH